MVMAFDIQATADHGHHHLGAKVLVMIHGGHREITLLVTRTITEIVLLAAGIPAAFFGVDKVETVLLTLIEANVVEDEKLSFSAEIGGVGNAGGTEVELSLLGDVARITVIALLGDRID